MLAFLVGGGHVTVLHQVGGGQDPPDVAIERRCVRCGSGDHGKPALEDTSAGIHFSLAHSGAHVVVALSRAG